MDDREYFKRRAEAERNLAIKATDANAARSHFELAREYEWRLLGEPRPEQHSARGA